jgi:lipopolysaccharide/colanic/teichoic acid biosynthesis glycosyltransferase/uncharacterized protein YbjT (DUF2867 family)
MRQGSTKRIVLTGASGFVGRLIVPLLRERGFDLLLAGRQPQALAALFPGCGVAGYDELEALARGADAMVHLATLNTTSNGTAGEFTAVNVAFARQMADMAQRAGVGHFIHVTSVHALHASRTDAYASSKRAAMVELSGLASIAITQMVLPAVVGSSGDAFAGKLAVLNRVPKAMRPAMLALLGALRPTVTAACVADWIADNAGHPPQAGDDSRIILSEGQEGNRVYAAARLVLDMGFAAFVALALGWLLVLVWLAVLLTSPGPGLFRQVRMGRGERRFALYKFRTMHTGTRQAATHEVPKSAITPLGQKLRRFKIDELPQAINILRRELTLIGPRPCLPEQHALIKARAARGVDRLMPGLTGLAQVQGIDMSQPERLAKADALYGAMRCLSLDLRIMLATVGLARVDLSWPDLTPPEDKAAG